MDVVELCSAEERQISDETGDEENSQGGGYGQHGLEAAVSTDSLERARHEAALRGLVNWDRLSHEPGQP